MLIDTGYPGQFNGFCKELKKNNIGAKGISYILLNHAHDDHTCFLNDLLGSSDAKVILHLKAVERLKEGQNSFTGGCVSYLALIFCEIMKLLGK